MLKLFSRARTANKLLPVVCRASSKRKPQDFLTLVASRAAHKVNKEFDIFIDDKPFSVSLLIFER